MSFVYIAHNHRNPPNILKVGMAKDVPSRMESLSQDTGVVGYFRPLHVFKVADMRKAESSCHKALKDFRREGEFFEISFKDCFRICFSNIREFLDPSDPLYDQSENNLPIGSGNPVSDEIMRITALSEDDDSCSTYPEGHSSRRSLCIKSYCTTCDQADFIQQVVLSAFGEENEFLDDMDLRKKAFSVNIKNSAKMKIFQACLMDLQPESYVAWFEDKANDFNIKLKRWKALRRIFDHYYDEPKGSYEKPYRPSCQINNVDCLSIVKHWLKNKPGFFISACWKELITHPDMSETDFKKNIESIIDEFELAYERLSEKDKSAMSYPTPEPSEASEVRNWDQRDLEETLKKPDRETEERILKNLQLKWNDIVEEHSLWTFPKKFHGKKRASLHTICINEPALFDTNNKSTEFTNFRYKINQAIHPDMHVDNIEFESVTNEYFNQYVSKFNDKKNND